MNTFDFQAIFTAITGAIGTAYDVVRLPLASLLVAVGGCLSTGCGPTAWNAKHVQTEMGTQFEIGYVSESKIIIGFPGKVKATGNASGEYTPEPKPSGPISMEWTNPAASDYGIQQTNKMHELAQQPSKIHELEPMAGEPRAYAMWIERPYYDPMPTVAK